MGLVDDEFEFPLRALLEIREFLVQLIAVVGYPLHLPGGRQDMDPALTRAQPLIETSRHMHSGIGGNLHGEPPGFEYKYHLVRINAVAK